ncbi:hypothetical protein [Pseudooctadecabacter sp.]|uniref:hypothetical protein n=1 Tax=Pseudooctadecabacter sp. TaxID=1966338 RepID=UPI0035C7E4B3
MTKSFAFLAAAALTLSACDVVETAAVDTGRDAARAVVGPIVADTVPGAAGQVLTNCIIDNASGQELLTLAAGGASPDNITLVSNILARTETVACATSGLT